MKKISSRYKKHPVAVTIGVFDGVHRGHRKILSGLLKIASRYNARTLAITFHPHPRKIIDPGSKVPLLTTLEHRLELISDTGVHFYDCIRFGKSVSGQPPEEFIHKNLVARFNITAVVVGEDFRFGKKKKGDIETLKHLGEKYGFRVFPVRSVNVDGKPISSTRIREHIQKGRLKKAGRMLGRTVSIFGTVVAGRRIGKKLGFPTANLDPHHEAVPPGGVYAVDVEIGTKTYKGVLNIGIRPTFRRLRRRALELHIFNFRRDIYGKELRIIFKKKIRNEKKFSSPEDLREQIKKDLKRAS